MTAASPDKLLEGRISGLQAETLAACRFRIGSVLCAAFAAIAEQIICHNGYVGHTVRVVGTVVESDGRKSLVVTTLELID